MARVAKFVDDNVIDKIEWQLHEPDVETDRAGAAATPPPCAGITEPKARIQKAVLHGECAEFAAKIRFGLCPQCLKSSFFNEQLGFAVGCLRADGNGNL